MAYDVKFLTGTKETYDGLSEKEQGSFYRLTDSNEVYLGEIKLSNEDISEEDLTNLKVSIDDSTSDSNYAKVYIIKQGDETVGTINIPLDLVVSKGEVVTDPDEDHQGTYIKLTIANSNEDAIYINVQDLCDVYTAEADAVQVQIEISSTNEISATIVDNAITTSKIADDSVTEAKLAEDIQNALANANSAVQSVTESDENGYITVDGEDVAIHGLGSAAYTNSSDYDEAGAADAAEEAAKEYTDTALTWQEF